MRDHSHLDGRVRQAARFHDDQLLALRDLDAEEELTCQIMGLPRGEVAAGQPLTQRSHRPRWRPVLAGLATIAVIATVLVVGGPVGAPPAIADWAAEPTPLTENERDEFDAFCRQGAQPGEPSPILTGDDQLVIADKRGRITYGLYVAPDGRLSNCHHWQGVPGSRHLAGGSPAGTSYAPVLPLQRPLDVHDARPSFEAFGQASAQATYGRTNDDVEQVTFRLDDGRSLTASMNDGHYLGWWPTNCSGSRAARQCTPKLLEVEARNGDGMVLDRWVRLDPDDDFEFVPAEEAEWTR